MPYHPPGNNTKSIASPILHPRRVQVSEVSCRDFIACVKCATELGGLGHRLRARRLSVFCAVLQCVSIFLNMGGAP